MSTTVIESSKIHLVNKYFSDLLQSGLIETHVKIAMSAFNVVRDPHFLWRTVDPEIKYSVFTVIQEHSRGLPAIWMQPRDVQSNTLALQKQLWASNLFWAAVPWSCPSPYIYGIAPPCLQLLRESLELYHGAATTLAGDNAGTVSVDVTLSKRLLAEVKDLLSRHEFGAKCILALNTPVSDAEQNTASTDKTEKTLAVEE
ncbi:hypothetical protein C8R45DRAFT_1112297 [Mycena sanguinolenta]|nr:hypothetical protein C8R45DRAFT_1112297 [Mycena sanguinolenta]